MDKLEYETLALTAMNDAEYILSNAVEILGAHERGEEGYSVEDLIFTHYNATVHYFPRGGGFVEAHGGIFRNKLRIEYSKRKVTLIVDKMVFDKYAEQAPFSLQFSMRAPKFINAITDVVEGKVKSKIMARSIEE